MERKSIHGDLLLDRYRIRRRFEGGMGLLWTVTDTHTGRPYAIKTIRPGDPRLKQRFLEEARTWIALDQHENLVQALWLIEEPSGPYLVLEFVGGSNLAELLAASPFALERTLDLAMQCARGLAYAHTHPIGDAVGVVHRDLKPQNLLVTPDDRLKITDFGLARPRQAEPGDDPGMGVGTPAYTAPEQLRGERTADGRADVYSFGVLLHEMLSGSNPFAAQTIPEQIERALHLVPAPLAGVPPALAALAGRCIAKDPADRPGDFGAVLAHLARTARTIEHRFHVDPHSIPPPEEPTGLIVEPPVLRPRQPRAGLPFAVEARVSGDFGPGPLDVAWNLAAPAGLELLTPRAGNARRLSAGGPARLALRLHLVAGRDRRYQVPPSLVQVRGPRSVSEHPVPAFEIDVAAAFVPPLVGRESAMAALRKAVAAGGSLFLSGPMGSGKSRLLMEAARLGVEAGRRIVASRAQEAGLRPMRVLNELARRLLGLSRDSSGGVRAAVNDLLGEDPSTANYFAQMLLGGATLESETPLARRWILLLEAAARRGPILLLLDDLHFADEEAIRAVAEIAARARESSLPVSFVATFTIDVAGAPARRRLQLLEGRLRSRGLERLELAPLGRDDVGRLLDLVFAGHGFAEEAPWLLDTITSVSEGNPAFVVGILRRLRREFVSRQEGEWRLAAELTPGRVRAMVPKALDTAVRARLQSLSAPARRVLTYAAFVGEEFDVALLRAALDASEAVEQALAEMERAEVVRPVEGGLDRYHFWSAAVAPVVERDLRRTQPARARSIHRAVAEAMLAVYSGRRRLRHALSIAHHLRAAGLRARSLPFTLAGCERLLGLQLPGRASRLLFNARPLVEAAGIDAALRRRFHFLYGIACEAAGEYDEGLAALTDFVQAGAALPDRPRSLARAYARLGRIHRRRGDFARTQECLAAARERLEALDDRRGLAFVLTALAELAVDRGELHAAQPLLARARKLATETGNEGALIRAEILAGRLALDLDRTAEARRAFTDAARRAGTLGDRERLAAALKGLGLVHLRRGYLRPALARFEQAVRLAVRMGDRPGLAALFVHLGSLHRVAGRVTPALRSLRRAQRLFGEIGHPEGVAAARHQIGILLRRRGETTQAVAELAGACEEFQRLRLPDRTAALGDLGRALADAGSERAARIALARADRLAPAVAARRVQRVMSREVRARLALAARDLRRARAVAASALRQSARTSGHGARIVAHRVVAEVALRQGDLPRARDSASTALAFAREQGDLLAAADCERILLELDGRDGQLQEARQRAHRVARAYTRRADAGDGPARLLLALSGVRGLRRGPRYLRAARRCYRRLEAQGFRTPDIAAASPSRYDSAPQHE